MSEERTQGPSKLRVQQARERGQVAHSAELTGAAGLLAAAALLTFWGGDLARAFIDLIREPLVAAPIVSADPAEVVARLRHLALALARPFGVVAAGASLAAVLAHQAQVGGLWVPGLLAPDPARLWAAGRGPGLAARGARGAWSLLKSVALLAVAGWSIHSGWLDYHKLAAMETAALAETAGRTLGRLTLTLAATTLALGLVDFGLQYQRFQSLMGMTPEEHREDQRSMEGDPALRARRRRLAKSWWGDSAELLTGATLVLTGPGGLTVLLAGGPPPRRVSLRAALQGAAGMRLRAEAESAKLGFVAAPVLAGRLARRRGPTLPLAAEHLAELAAVWPAETPRPAPGRGPHGPVA